MAKSNAKPIYGIHAIVQVQPAGDTPPDDAKWITIKNSKYAIKPKANIKEAGNTTDGMIRCSGLNDYELKIDGHTDTTSAATAPETNLMATSQIYFRAFRNGVTDPASAVVTGDFWAGRAIISDLDISTGIDDTEDWSVSAMKQSGYLLLPGGGNW